MQLGSLGKVGHAAFTEAARTIGRNLNHSAISADFQRLLDAGINPEIGAKIVQKSTLLRQSYILQRSLQARYRGEALDPQAVKDAAIVWGGRGRAGVGVAKADNDPDWSKLALLVGVGEDAVQSIRDARVMVETTLSNLTGINLKRLGLNETFLADGEAIVNLFEKEVDERDDVLLSREATTRSLYELKEEVVELIDQVLSRIEVIEADPAQPRFVGFDLGSLRALVATRGQKLDDSADDEGGGEPGL